MPGQVWTDDEIAKLSKAQASGKSWKEIAAAHFPGRTGAACRIFYNALQRDVAAVVVKGRVTEREPTREDAERACARLLAAQIAADQICPVPMAAWIARHGQPGAAA